MALPFIKSSVKDNCILFDPLNTLSASNRETINAKPWLEREPAIALFHEMLHIYYQQYPAIFPLADGTELTLFGGGNMAAENMIVGGGVYTHDDGTRIDFGDDEFVSRHLLSQVQYISENHFRDELGVNIRPYYSENTQFDSMEGGQPRRGQYYYSQGELLRGKRHTETLDEAILRLKRQISDKERKISEYDDRFGAV